VERSLTMGGAFAFPDEHGVVTFNDPDIQAAEIPAANGVATSRALARIYAGCVSAIDGPPLLSPAALAEAMVVRAAGPQLSGMPDDGTRWGTGFQLASPPTQPMLGPASFGHAGAGGQLAFGDLEHEVGFAYLTNQMGGYGDARARELTAALRRVLRV
jgi:CubicO group peptidase (beta-lactamase class C family)